MIPPGSRSRFSLYGSWRIDSTIHSLALLWNWHLRLCPLERRGWRAASSALHLTGDALIHFADGTCYWPGCPEPVMRTSANGFRLALQIAHIRAVSPGGPRYDTSMSKEERNSFSNIMLLCYFHHTEIDANEQRYPVEVLREWKEARVSRRQETLPNSVYLTEESLQNLIVGAFSDRDNEIRDTLSRLEDNDRDAAEILRSLLGEIDDLRSRGSIIDPDLVGTLDSAAGRLGHLQDTAGWLLDGAQRLSHLEDTAGWLLQSASTLGNLGDDAASIERAASTLSDVLDSQISRLEYLISQLRGLRDDY
jgi:hypothetical protein